MWFAWAILLVSVGLFKQLHSAGTWTGLENPWKPFSHVWIFGSPPVSSLFIWCLIFQGLSIWPFSSADSLDFLTAWELTFKNETFPRGRKHTLPDLKAKFGTGTLSLWWYFVFKAGHKASPGRGKVDSTSSW